MLITLESVPGIKLN